MNNPQVSVIIPVYNTGQYLNESVDSVCKQTLSDIEVIIVNDGSTDNSADILKEMIEKDVRIQYYEQYNNGQSVARNTGMQHAKGDYIYFMDSDDILKVNALEECYKKCKLHNLDLIFFDGDILRNGDINSVCWDYCRTARYEENKIYKGKWLLNDMLDNFTYRAVPWLLFVKHSYIREKQFSFYPNIIHEDELYTVKLILESSSIGCLKQSLVKHRVRDNSTMTKEYSIHNVNCYLTVVCELFKFSKLNNYEMQYVVKKYARYTLSKVFYTAHVLRFKDKLKLLIRCVYLRYLGYIGAKSLIVFFIKK